MSTEPEKKPGQPEVLEPATEEVQQETIEHDSEDGPHPEGTPIKV